METIIYLNYQANSNTISQFIDHIECGLHLFLSKKIWILLMLFGLILDPLAAEEQNTLLQSSNSKNILKVKQDPTKPKKILGNGQIADPNNPDNQQQVPLKLSLILISESDKVATINQISLREKEQILGLEIIKIENNKVLLQPIATQTATLEQQLQQLADANDFIKKHIVNGYIELKLPNISVNQPIINFEPPNIIHDKKKLSTYQQDPKL